MTRIPRSAGRRGRRAAYGGQDGVEAVAAGNCAPAVETGDGRFVGKQPGRVGPGFEQPLTMILVPAQGSTPGGGLSAAAKRSIAGGIIVVGALLVFGLDSNAPVSPFEPGD